MFEIEFTPESLDDLEGLKKHEQVEIFDEIETQLCFQPTEETKKRKRLRPNQIAEWELRIGKFRVFYNVDKESLTVSIEAVGFKSEMYYSFGVTGGYYENNLCFRKGKDTE